MTADPFPSTRATGAFERRMARALEAAAPGCERLLVAVSGGPDSTAALIAVSRALGADGVTAAHFDHRLRSTEEAEQERALVAALAERLGCAFTAGRSGRAPRDHSEEAARETRYRWLATALAASGASVCVTGHTQDDQAETVLLRLARGSGARGVAGMSAVAPWPVPTRRSQGLILVRPLLGVSRREVEAYLAALGVPAVADPTNASLEYARNRVRTRVLPELRAVNAKAVEHLAQFAERQREDDDALRALALAWLEAHAVVAPGEVAIDRSALRAAAPAVARRAVREAAERLGIALDGAHVQAILGSASRNGARVDLPLARSETDGRILRLRLRPSPTGTD